MGRAAVMTMILLCAAAGAAVWLLSQPPSGPAGRTGLTENAAAETRGGATDVPGPGGLAADRPPDGGALAFALIEPPSAAYGTAAWTESDRKYAADLEALEVAYDPALGRAARELAVIYSREHWPLPTEALQFVVNAAGAAEWGVLQSYLTTTDLSEGAVADRVTALMDKVEDAGEGIRVGVGESYSLGSRTTRVVAVLVSGGGLYLEPISRNPAPGSLLRLAGTLPLEATKPQVIVMGPDGRFEDLPTRHEGDRFEAVWAVPEQRGAALIEIVAQGAHGPTPLAQLELAIGGALPQSFETRWPPAEEAVANAAEAETLARALLSADRARYGLKPLTLDPVLSRVARSHSTEMREQGFFGHVSPRTGSVGDRVRAAGYAPLFVAENIAANSSIWDAEAGLFYSLGHRKNILTQDATHVGIGVAVDEAHGRRRWLLTQVFARPIPVVHVTGAREDLYVRFSEAAGAVGATRPSRSPGLERAAQAEAASSEATPRGALDRAKAAGALHGRAYGWVSHVADLASFQVPAEAYTHAPERIGIGVHQDRRRPAPNIVVVVIVGGDG